jgi:hypothetical protein
LLRLEAIDAGAVVVGHSIGAAILVNVLAERSVERRQFNNNLADVAATIKSLEHR